MKALKYIMIVLIAFLLSCKKENMCDCFKGTGEVISESRTLASFNTIYLEDNVDVVLVEDTLNYAVVEAGEKLIGLVRTDIQDTVLSIGNDNKCNWVRSFSNRIKVSLHCSGLEYIQYFKASGDLSSEGILHGKYLQIDSYNGSGAIRLNVDVEMSAFNLHTGPADMDISGASEITYLYSAGNGIADLGELETGGMYMLSKSTNNCYLNVTKTLVAELGYVGDVYYRGNPVNIDLTISSTGKLIPY